MKPVRPVVVITFADGIEGAHLQLLKNEKTELENSLWDLHTKDLIEIYKEESLSRKELVDLLPRFDQDRIILFHYAGHAGSSGIHTEGGEARAQGVAALLGQEKSLQLVVLNGCSTMEQVKGLMDNGVKAVIATSSKIGDEAAKNFSTTFYKQLARGHSLKDAFNYAIAAAQTEKEVDSSIIPMRSIEIDEEKPDAVPWDLYYDENHPEILDWKLPSPGDPKENIDPSIYKDPNVLLKLGFAEKKDHLLMVLDNDINRIIPDLDVLISGNSKHRQTIQLLNVQMNDYFRNKYSGAVSKEELDGELRRIRLKLLHLISVLEANDFETEVKGYPRSDTVQGPPENIQKGGIWRKIPLKMQVNKPIECRIKIAADKDQLKQERAASDIRIRIDTIRVSSEMEVDLFEPPLGDTPSFDIKFMGSKTQVVDPDEPTEWIFYVTPLKEGRHKLMLQVKVVDKSGSAVKVIPFQDEIEIVTYEPEELGVYEKMAILNFLPLMAIPAVGKGEKEPAQKAKPAAKPATKSAGTGIGKILAGIVALAALAALAWFGLKDQLGAGDLSDSEPVQQEETTPPPQDNAETAPVEAAPAEAEPPKLKNGVFNYEMTVDESLALPFSSLIDGPYLADYTFKITQGGSSDKLGISTTADALNFKALKEGSHALKFQICRDQKPCSSGDINVTIKAKAVPKEEEKAPPPPPPPATDYEYDIVNGQSQPYNTVKISDTWWTRQNLKEPGGMCYLFDDANCKKYGSLYYYDLAKAACQGLGPGTWTLPTPDDWNVIKNSKSHRNMLNLKKGGYMVQDTSSQQLGVAGRFWSTPGIGFEISGSSLSQKSVPGNTQLSCRCVKK